MTASAGFCVQDCNLRVIYSISILNGNTVLKYGPTAIFFLKTSNFCPGIDDNKSMKMKLCPCSVSSLVEHEVLQLSICDLAVSVVQGSTILLGALFSSIPVKICQNYTTQNLLKITFRSMI